MIDSFEAFTLLLLLLPGIVGYFLYIFVVDVKPTGSLSSVYLVLFFMLLTQVISIKLFGQGFLPTLAGTDDPQRERNIHAYIQNLPIAPFVISALLGIVSAIIKNKAVDYYFLNTLRITHKISERNPWNTVFARKREIWLIIRFKDGTSLIGWPDYYSDSDKEQQLYLQSATWHVPVEETKTLVPPNSCGIESHDVGAVLLTNFDAVAAIEVQEAKSGED